MAKLSPVDSRSKGTFPDFPPPRCMHLVSIPLNSFVYRFRRLTWRDESTIVVPIASDPREALLAYALHDVSGMKITSVAQAAEIIRAIPRTFRGKIFTLYKADLPDDRYYTSADLYEAPAHNEFHKRLLDEGDAEDIDPADRDLEQRFGLTEAREARELESRLAKEAVKAQGSRNTGSDPTEKRELMTAKGTVNSGPSSANHRAGGS